MKKFLTMTVLCAAVAVGLSGCGDKKDSAPAQSKQASSTITVSMARFSLRRVRLNSSNFINALTGKLFWGEDIRNGNIQ